MIIAGNPPLYTITTLGIHKGNIEWQRVQANNTSSRAQIKMLNNNRELPMPNVSRLSNLSQAQATLLHCWTKLSKFTLDYPSPSPSPVTPQSAGSSPILEKRSHYQRWLEQWEAAFTTFLTNAMASMTSEDVTQSRILKTNHLACTILASEADLPAPSAFEPEFRAIVELAGAVLKSRHFLDSAQDTKANEPTATTTGLDVKDPLHIVLSRCNDAKISGQAFELLSRFYPH